MNISKIETVTLRFIRVLEFERTPLPQKYETIFVSLRVWLLA